MAEKQNFCLENEEIFNCEEFKTNIFNFLWELTNDELTFLRSGNVHQQTQNKISELVTGPVPQIIDYILRNRSNADVMPQEVATLSTDFLASNQELCEKPKEKGLVRRIRKFLTSRFREAKPTIVDVPAVVKSTDQVPHPDLKSDEFKTIRFSQGSGISLQESLECSSGKEDKQIPSLRELYQKLFPREVSTDEDKESDSIFDEESKPTVGLMSKGQQEPCFIDDGTEKALTLSKRAKPKLEQLFKKTRNLKCCRKGPVSTSDVTESLDHRIQSVSQAGMLSENQQDLWITEDLDLQEELMEDSPEEETDEEPSPALIPSRDEKPTLKPFFKENLPMKCCQNEQISLDDSPKEEMAPELAPLTNAKPTLQPFFKGNLPTKCCRKEPISPENSHGKQSYPSTASKSWHEGLEQKCELEITTDEHKDSESIIREETVIPSKNGKPFCKKVWIKIKTFFGKRSKDKTQKDVLGTETRADVSITQREGQVREQVERSEEAVRVLVRKIVALSIKESGYICKKTTSDFIEERLFRKMWAEVRGELSDVAPQKIESCDRAIFKEICKIFRIKHPFCIMDILYLYGESSFYHEIVVSCALKHIISQKVSPKQLWFPRFQF